MTIRGQKFMNKKSLGIYLAGGILSVSLFTVVHAAGPKPEAVVDYRQSVYSVIGWNFKPIGAMVKGEVPFDAAAVARHAQYVELMSKAALEGFPKGSGPDAVKDTEAKAEIWTNWDKFEIAMKNFQQEATTLTKSPRAATRRLSKRSSARPLKPARLAIRISGKIELGNGSI
jgi:cytochrome c556